MTPMKGAHRSQSSRLDPWAWTSGAERGGLAHREASRLECASRASLAARGFSGVRNKRRAGRVKRRQASGGAPRVDCATASRGGPPARTVLPLRHAESAARDRWDTSISRRTPSAAPARRGRREARGNSTYPTLASKPPSCFPRLPAASAFPESRSTMVLGPDGGGGPRSPSEWPEVSQASARPPALIPAVPRLRIARNLGGKEVHGPDEVRDETRSPARGRSRRERRSAR